MIYYILNIKRKKFFIEGLILDYFEAQNKYRQKQLKTFLSTIIKLIIFSLAFLIGWWLGNSDKLVLIQENEKIITQFNEKKDNLERQITDIRLKLKEANLSLDTQNIKNLNSDFGRDAKNLLASNLAKGVPEETIVNALRLLGTNKVCSSFLYKELPVSTQSFTPPISILLLLSGSLKIKAEGNINDKSNDNPYFNPMKPIRITFIYFGNNDLVEGNLPISKNILAGKFSVKIKVLKSKVRGVVIVRYQTCKVS